MADAIPLKTEAPERASRLYRSDTGRHPLMVNKPLAELNRLRLSGLAFDLQAESVPDQRG